MIGSDSTETSMRCISRRSRAGQVTTFITSPACRMMSSKRLTGENDTVWARRFQRQTKGEKADKVPYVLPANVENGILDEDLYALHGNELDNVIVTASTWDLEYNYLVNFTEPFHSQLLGFGGDDIIVGSYSFDLLDGGEGNDWLDGGEHIDTLRPAATATTPTWSTMPATPPAKAPAAASTRSKHGHLHARRQASRPSC